MLSPEDQDLWRKVTEGVLPLFLRPAAVTPFGRRKPADFSTRLDLHGYTLCEAHPECRAFVANAHLRGIKSVTIITGLSGAIRKEFCHWAELMPQVRRIEPLNGGGAFKLYLKKPK